jgi:hypothetical protein
MMMIIMGHQCEREIGLRGISGEGGGKETILRGEEDQNMLHTHTHTNTHTCDQENFQILGVPLGRIHSRTHGYNWSLLKVREGNYKRKHGGPRRKLEVESLPLCSRCF